MKKTALLLCLFLINLQGYAKHHVDTFSFQINQRIDTLMPFNKVKIIDKRENKSLILFGDDKNKYYQLIAEKPLQNMVEEIGNQIYTNPKNNNKELLIFLYEFELNSVELVNSLRMRMDVFIGENDRYQSLGERNIYDEQRSNKLHELNRRQMTFEYSKIINESFYSFFNSLSAIEFPVNQTKTYTLMEAENRFKRKYDAYPVYQATNYKTGVYMTVSKFLANEPDTNYLIGTVINDIEKAVVVYQVKENGKKGMPLKDGTYFAVYDGVNWYYNNGSRNIKMRKENGEFYANYILNGLVKPEITNLGDGGMMLLTNTIINAINKNKKVRELYYARFNPLTQNFIKIKRISDNRN